LSKVRTVLGDVEPASLGLTLVHEHLVIDWAELLGRPRATFDYDTTVELIAARLRAAEAFGVGAMGECTPIGAGRYVDLIVDVARRTNVKIVASTGFFHESWAPMHPLALALDLDAMTDLLTREITEGMGSTTVRAGLMKCATGAGRISPAEEKVLRATARTHRATGAPIVTHITGGLEAEQIDLFGSEGVEPSALCISHVGSGPQAADRLLGALRRGANVSVDQIGYPFEPDAVWIEVVALAVRAGFIDQVMIAHDTSVLASGPETVFGEAAGASDYGYIPRVFVPGLQRVAGLSDGQIATILETNPQRFLAF
jgi:phosphotriesterase-related protein